MALQPQVTKCNSGKWTSSSSESATQRDDSQNLMAAIMTSDPQAGITSPHRLPDLLGQVNISRELLRGVELTTTLSNRGYLWRKSPVDLSVQEQQGLWHYSHVCSEMDYFISHTWWTPGEMKYIALLVRFGWNCGAVGGLMTALLIFLLVSLNLVPNIHYEKAIVLSWEGTVPIGLWCTLLGPPVGLLLVMCPKLWCVNPDIFFDAVCINQVDEMKKAEGVYSLAGFLKNARKLLVLWSPPYFSRLWCVYEVAAFRFFNPSSQVIFSPLCVQIAVLYSYISLWMIANLLLLAKLLGLALGSVYLSAIVLLVGTLVFGVAISYSLRHLMVERSGLEEQLEFFDIRHASCRDEADRKYIFASVVIWFGSAEKFNEYVRSELRQEIMRIEQASLSYKYALTCSFPFLCFFLDELSGFIQAGVPFLGILGYSLQGLAVVFCVLPMMIYLCFSLSKHFSKTRPTKLHDVAINIAIGSCFSLLTVINVTFGRIAYQSNFYGCVTFFLATALVTSVTFVFFQLPPSSEPSSSSPIAEAATSSVSLHTRSSLSAHVFNSESTTVDSQEPIGRRLVLDSDIDKE